MKIIRCYHCSQKMYICQASLLALCVPVRGRQVTAVRVIVIAISHTLMSLIND